MVRAEQRQSTACLRILGGVLSAALFISFQAPQATMVPSLALTAILWAAERWSASAPVVVAVPTCESALNAQAYNASSGSSGLFQFLPATYWAYARLAGETRNYWLASGSANVAAWMFAHGFA